MSSSSLYVPYWSSATQRRPLQPSDNPNPDDSGHRHPLIDQAPTPRPLFQLFALVFIVFLGLLQFLPATHFRDPSDPYRNWVPFSSIDSGNNLRNFSDRESGVNGEEPGIVHIVSWMECLDLRVLAVLANSTLSGSRYPHLLHFHFFIPKGNEDKVSFYKLKVLFPHSNLEIHGQEEVKEVIRTAMSGMKHPISKYEDIVPFVIPSVHRFLSKFIYISPNVIVKGNVEELTGVDLSYYAIAAAEDCSKSLDTYVNSDILDAIQRSASKPWVSETPYATNSCMPDLSLVLIDSRKLEKDFLEAFLWWSKVLNWSESRRNPAISLALYNGYLKLSSSWLVRDSTSLVFNESFVTRYDGPKTVCSESGDSATTEPGYGNLWTVHLPATSDRIVRD
ncbi:uncharacterized protein LOC123218282 isoform X2 [Mangifera indica]|uniref:uncharacterized protein LOC123218282 isoform X2 n=1 Tax=Mangifera indica TaxID=29780 RepID=UPI001CFA4224|nr:uncharacterized protein LOC123218282 isoform X2 [Mangifera indica]